MLIRRYAAVLPVLVIASAATGCSISGSSLTGSKGYASGDGSVVTIAPGNRKPAPDLSGNLVGGGTASVAAERGSVVVLNVWAQWCAPCRAEAPQLAAAAKKLPDVTFLGINTKDSDTNALAFERAQHVPYPSFSDQSGDMVLDLQSVIAMSALPITVVLDKSGRVAAAIYGPTTAITLEDITQSLEKES